MIQWLKQRRLKVASTFSIGGDGLMGISGAAGLFAWVVPKSGAADIILLIAGIIAVIGHAMVILFGHGGARGDGKQGRGLTANSLMRALMFWRYPLDFGFACFVCSGVLYALAGYLMGNHPLAVTGVLVLSASLIGWLAPHERKICGFAMMQVTAATYMCATIMQFWASFVGHNIFMFLAAVCYATCNAIYATVRKENQSAYTRGE